MSAPARKLNGSKPKLPDNTIPVPLVQQETNFSCGAAALLSVFKYWGATNNENERRLRKELGTSPQAGTGPRALVRIAELHGLDAEHYTDSSMEDLRTWNSAGDTPIVDIQAWDDDDKDDYNTEDDAGHYVVVIGFDKNNIYFMDPSSESVYAYLSQDDFEERWHDVEEDGEVQTRSVIWIAGDTPAVSDPETSEVERMG